MARHVTAALALICAVWAHSAWAAGPRVKLDRVEAEPSWFHGVARVRLFITAVALEGSIIPVASDAWILAINGSTTKPPVLAGHYEDVDSQLVCAVVIETGFEVAADLPAIQNAVAGFLGALPRSTRVAVIEYGESIHGGRKLLTPGQAQNQIEQARADDVPASPRLIEALGLAIKTLDKAQPTVPGAPLRKMIVVLSDGKDGEPTPDRYRKLGKRAGKAGIRIHSIAYSPVDNRRPLLGLGEMSKRSDGTFRWVRSREGFSSQFKTLTDEVDRQYVLTYFVPRDSVTNKRVAARYKDFESNEVKVGELLCGSSECKRRQYCHAHQCVTRNLDRGAGLLGWIAYLAAGAVGLLAILVLVGYMLSRRDKRGPARADAAFARARVGSENQPAAATGEAGHDAGHWWGRPPNPPVEAAASSNRIVAAGWDGSQVGSSAPAPAPAMPAQAPNPPGIASAGTASFYVVKGPGAGQTLLLSHGFTIGSARNCHLVLAGDSAATAHHAQIVMDTAGNCTIVDRGSHTGTFVNGVRSQQMQLRHGMLIKIGGCELRFMQQ